MDEELGEKQYSVPDLLRGFLSGFLSGFFGFVESLVWGDSSYKQIKRKQYYTLKEFMVLQKKNVTAKLPMVYAPKVLRLYLELLADLFTILQHYFSRCHFSICTLPLT